MASCHGCADHFGFWKKNVGCPKCGYSYCQKCIRFKIELSDTGSTPKGNTLVVCQKCYLEAQAAKSNENIRGYAPESIQKENVGKAMEVLETLDNPGKPPITLYRESNRVAALKKGLSIEDQKIVDRLEELRGVRRKSEQGADDVAARLAKLKDQPYDSSPKSSPLRTQKAETEDELVSRLANQVNLDKKYEDALTRDIEARLRKLQQAESGSSSQGDSPTKSSIGETGMESKSEQEQIDEIMQRYLAEAALPIAAASAPKESQDDENEDVAMVQGSSEEDDDLDYDQCCRICEEKRATIMCRECDDDIFCRKCFKEFHDELGESHKPATINNTRGHLH